MLTFYSSVFTLILDILARTFQNQASFCSDVDWFNVYFTLDRFSCDKAHFNVFETERERERERC